MADIHTSRRAPADWHVAFAALPLEAPPADGWQRVAATLARTPRRRVPAWAIAAAIACLAAAPALWWLRTPPPSAPPPVAATRSAPGHPATAIRAAVPAATPADAAVAPATTVAVATPDGTSPSPASTAGTVADGGTDPDLERLYAESARLEALLAQLSAGLESGDGVQLALTSSLRGRLAGIDAALADAALDEDARAGLWHQRVDALRQLAGLAADQRWNALYGATAEYALVQVH